MNDTDFRRSVEAIDSVIQPLLPFLEEKTKTKIEDGLYEIRTNPPRPEGEWIEQTYRRLLPRDVPPDYNDDTYNEKNHSVEDTKIVCSCCGEKEPMLGGMAYCGYCGAKMKKEVRYLPSDEE